MLKGLYTSIFGATDQGIFDVLYSDYGASPPVKRMDIRLGDYGVNPEDDVEDDKPDATTATNPKTPGAKAVPMSAAPANSSGGFFTQDIAGFPIWLIGVGFLGFAWSYRRKSKKQSSRRK